MKENLTEIVFLLDRSGSMDILTLDTIGGYNSFLETQKKEDGEAIVSTILFDNRYEVLHDRVNLKDIKPLTTEEYFARGTTALMDAIGITINTIGARLSITNEEDRPSKVIFVIITDGLENASKEFNKNIIKQMIEHQTNKYNWQFLFLGANMDAVKEAESIGIGGWCAQSYTADSVGTKSVYTSLSRGISDFRENGTIDSSWKDTVQ